MNTRNLLRNASLLDTLCASSEDFESPCRIVACGIFGAGKSALLNVLSGRVGKEYFEVGSGRKTSVCKDLIDGGVQWVDTPGLDGGNGDDGEADKAVRVADILLFVHHPGTGELHGAEVDFIRETARHPESCHRLTERLLIVLTHRESHNELQLGRLQYTVARQVASETGTTPDILTVSSTLYLKGVKETKPKLKELSGLHVLRRRLGIMAYRPGVIAHRRERIANIGAALQQQIDQKIADFNLRRKMRELEIWETESALKEDFSRFVQKIKRRG